MSRDLMAQTEGRILAVDYGAKRVGLAVSDPLGVIARGAGTLENDGRLVERLTAIVRDEQIIRVVVGMPFAPDGGPGAKGREVQAFVDRLRSALPVEVAVWDESFTTVDAHRTFRDGGMKRKQRRDKARVDEMAARILLQEYLESNEHR